MFSITTSPAQPEVINSLTGVISHFQSDSNFKKIYQSNEEMGLLAELSAVCLNFGCQLAENISDASLHRITAYGKDSKVTIFSFHASKSENPGQRVFGLKLRKSIPSKAVVNKIAALI